MADYSSPVPLGHANSGGAVVLGDGTQALRYLIKTDELAAKARERAAAAAQRQKDLDAKDFASRLKLDPKAGVHFVPMLGKMAQASYDKLDALAVDTKLPRSQRAVAQQQLLNEYDRTAAASVKVDDHLAQLGQRFTADKRYDRDKTIAKLYDTLYQKDENGAPVVGEDGKASIISPVDYDPQTAEVAVGEGNEHLNGVEVFKTYLRGTHPDAVTYSKQPAPGGKGFKNSASSDVYELTDDGKIKYDPHTNLPVVKATPQSLNYFDSDPVSRQYLDGFEQQHQKNLTSAVDKMQRLEQLSPEESEAVRVEQSPEGRRMELFKRGLMEQGYGRQSTALLNRPAPRPRASSTKAPKFIQAGGDEFTPGVLGGTGVGGSAGVAHFGQTAPLTRTSSTGKVEQYSGNGVYHDYLLQRGDGSAVEHVTNNSNPQQLTYGGQVTLLRKSNGTVIFPHDPSIIKEADAGNPEPLKQWARTERAKDPNLQFAVYQSATPAKNAELNVGSAEELYQQIKAANAAQAQLASSTLTDKERHEAELMAAKMAAFNTGQARTGKAPLTEGQMRAMAQKLYGQQNAVMHIPYTGASKIQIDAHTGYALRNPKAQKARQDFLKKLDDDTRPTSTEQRQVTSGRGPLAGVVSPPTPTPKRTEKAAAPANPYGFKFKK